MEPRKLGTPRQIKITPSPNKSQFRFLLLFPETARREPIEFEMPAGGAMTLMRALQHLQALHKIPIPPSLRPRGGRPVLSVVKPDDA